MASAYALMKSGVRHMDVSLPPVVSGPAGAALSFVAEGAIGAGVSYGIGQIYHRHQDKWYGRNIAKIAMGVGKLTAIGIQLATGGGAHWTSGIADAVGQAGVNAYFLDMGLRHAREKTGKVAVLLPKGTALPAGATPVTAVGALGQAEPGRALSLAQIEELANMR